MVHRHRWFVASLAIALVACSEDDAYDACSPEHIVDDAEGVSAAPLRRDAEQVSVQQALDQRSAPTPER